MSDMVTVPWKMWLERVVRANARKRTKPPGALGVRTDGSDA